MNEYLCNNWFVIQVKTNKELFLKELLARELHEYVDILVFTRELLFERKKKIIRVESVLFPGYLFVHKKPQLVIDTIRKLLPREFIKPVCFKSKKCFSCFSDKAPCQVLENEMFFLLNNSDKNGMFRLSNVKKESEKIIIDEGPLKNMHGNIKWLNEKKKKAGVEILLFNRPVVINVGINVLKEIAG